MMERKKKETIQLSEHFTAGKLLRFAFLPVVSLLLSSFYGVVDAWFIANFTDQTAFAAVNIVSPYALMFPAVGFMIGGGGNALISKVLGEDDEKRAGRIFSMMTELCVITGVLVIILGEVLLSPFLHFQGCQRNALPVRGEIRGKAECRRSECSRSKPP